MDTDVSGPSLERFRHYLSLLARAQLGAAYRGKLDASDIVQQTLLDAHEKLSQFKGHTTSEMAAWLRQILARNLADVHRDFGREKREIARERSLNVELDQSSARLEQWLEAVQTSPVERVDKNEQLLRLAAALAQLPEPQRTAIELHHLHGFSLTDTAQQLERTEASVAGLLRRGLARLRELLEIGDKYPT
jgi:RNA polymerase sigma-70 factor (ECF subfamily)